MSGLIGDLSCLGGARTASYEPAFHHDVSNDQEYESDIRRLFDFYTIAQDCPNPRAFSCL